MLSPLVWIACVVLGALGLGALALLVRGRRPGVPASRSQASSEQRAGQAAAKICPVCGTRYLGNRRTCERDNTELATLN